MASEVYVGRVRSSVLLVLASVVTLTIYWFVWFWKFNTELYRHEAKGGRAAGRWLLFLLVPVIGWFLAVWLAGRHLRRLQVRAEVERPTTPSLAASWAGLVPVVGWLVAAALLQSGGNRLWLRLRDAFEVDVKAERTIECGTCHHTFGAFLNPLFATRLTCPSCGRVSES